MFLLMCRFCEMTTLHSAVWPTDRAVGPFRAGLWGGKGRSRQKPPEGGAARRPGHPRPARKGGAGAS